MSNEASVQWSLNIAKGNLRERRSDSFRADVAGTVSPLCPGLLATLVGADVDLSALAQPGLCRIKNLEPAGGNYIEVGTYDPDTGLFLPLLEVLPGESYPLRLSRFLGQEFGTAAGTGSTGSGVRLRVKAVGAPVSVIVEVFEA